MPRKEGKKRKKKVDLDKALKKAFEGVASPIKERLEKKDSSEKQLIKSQVLQKALIKTNADTPFINKKTEEQRQRLNEGTLIRVNKVGKYFGNLKILSGATFEIDKGDIFGIVGLSGSGKTTLLNLLIGFNEPDEGEVMIHLDNKLSHLSHHRKHVHKIFGFSSQENSFYEKLTGFENLVHFAILYNIKTKEAKRRAEELLNKVGLKDFKNIPAERLSIGMQKKLDIACAIINNPEILILDEPTANLDFYSRREIFDIIKDINHKGTTIIIASHFLQEIEELCSSVAILHNKKIVKVIKNEDLKRYSKGAEQIIIETETRDYSKITENIKKRGIDVVCIEELGQRLVITAKDVDEIFDDLYDILKKSKERIITLNVEKPDLTEIFDKIVSERT